MIKLITLNIWQGRLFRNYPDFLKEEQADIICLQEVYKSDKKIPTLELFSNISTAQEASGLEYSFFSPVHGYKVMGVNVQFGNCILSRTPLENQTAIFTSGEYLEFTDPSDYVNNIRNAQIASVNIDGQSLTVVNHHGYWELSPTGSNESTKSLGVLSQALSG
ncbi:MAG TPA: endonuclease/exonuclease/phosphatase family protein, partial [Candidatus Saccharimonadales bacterium]